MNGVAKTPLDPHRFSRPYAYFDSARSAFKKYLQFLELGASDIVLLPAYVGWSPREGSGVFDPIDQLGLSFRFYPLTRRLQISLPSFVDMLDRVQPKVVVLIHYFGRVDPACGRVAGICRERGIKLVEDEAHAMLSDLVGGICGRAGDAVLFSLHKMLPMADGGMLLGREHIMPLESIHQSYDPWAFDLIGIAQQRRKNAARIRHFLRGNSNGGVRPLWGRHMPLEVPQSFPVLVPPAIRDELYHVMNEEGLGVVSLYHTLIEPLREKEFVDTLWVSKRILNLPVHQDVKADDLEALLKRFVHEIFERRGN